MALGTKAPVSAACDALGPGPAGIPALRQRAALADVMVVMQLTKRGPISAATMGPCTVAVPLTIITMMKAVHAPHHTTRPPR